MAKKKKKKVPLRTQLRRLEKKADRAMSELVRATAIAKYKGRCPFCGRDPLLPVPSKDGKRMRKNGWVCFHFVRRRRKIVRWALENAVGACAFCNRIEVGNPDPYRAWYIRSYGHEQYLTLVQESEQSFQPTVEYLNRIIASFEKDLKELLAQKETAASSGSGGHG